MRWYAQAEALFAAAFDERAIDAVAEELRRLGAAMPDVEEPVQGDPGPTLWMGIAVDATDESHARTRATEVVQAALAGAGIERRTFRLLAPRVTPMTTIEAQRAAMAVLREPQTAGDGGFIEVVVRRPQPRQRP